mgnify:CR=1 FL=1
MSSIKSFTIKIGSDTKEFEKGLKKAEREIRSTQKSANDLAKSLKINYDENRAILAQKQFQKAIDQTEEKAKTLRKQLDYLENSGQIDTEAYAKFELELAQTEIQALKLREGLEKVKNVKIELLNQKIDKLGDSVTQIGQKMTGVSLAAAGVIAGAVAIGKSAAAKGAEIDDMTQQFDISAETIQRWNYLALQSGVDATAFTRALIRARAAMADLSTGTDNAATEALTALGISAGQFGSDEEMFDGIIKALANVKDSTLQTAYANEIFGDRIATQLLPYINAGSDDLAKWNAEFDAMPSLTGEESAALAELDDTFNRLSVTMEYATAQLGEALAPIIERVVEFIEGSVVPAIKSLAEWFGSLPEGMQNIILGLLGILAVASPLLILIGKIVPGLKLLTSHLIKLNKAQLITTAGFASLAGAAGLALNLIANWKNMTWVEKLLSMLAIAALVAAAAVTVFHASWSLGLAVGAIAAGVAAGIAAINAAAQDIVPEENINFTSDNIGSYATGALNAANAFPDYSYSGGGDSYSDTTYADQYNVTVNVTNPGASAEEIAEAVGREIATLAQSRR